MAATVMVRAELCYDRNISCLYESHYHEPQGATGVYLMLSGAAYFMPDCRDWLIDFLMI
jgi:hypothetical protein